MIRFLSFSALALSLIATAPVSAQSRRELAERIDGVEVRIGELESQFLAGDPVVETLLSRLDALDFQLRELTAESERLTFENRQLRDQVAALEAQLAGPAAPAVDPEAAAFMSAGLGDNASGELVESGVAVVDPDDPFAQARAEATGMLGGGMVVAPEAAEIVEPDTLFTSARSSLLDGDFDGAQLGFESFVQAYPDDPNAAEAWYWLGETFFIRSNFSDAADAYIASLRSSTDGAKAPDALVRLAASLHSLGRTDEACGTLGRFNAQFPNASQSSRDRAARERVRAGCG